MGSMMFSRLFDAVIDLNLKVPDSDGVMGLFWMGVIGMAIFLQR